MSALPLTVLNVSAALGRILVGFAADKLGPVNALWVAITLSGLTQLVVWTFVSTYAGIVCVLLPSPVRLAVIGDAHVCLQMVFAILYGFFCGCFLSLVSAVAAKVYGADRLAGLSGLLLLFNAPGTSFRSRAASLLFPRRPPSPSHALSRPPTCPSLASPRGTQGYGR